MLADYGRMFFLPTLKNFIILICGPCASFALQSATKNLLLNYF